VAAVYGDGFVFHALTSGCPTCARRRCPSTRPACPSRKTESYVPSCDRALRAVFLRGAAVACSIESVVRERDRQRYYADSSAVKVGGSNTRTDARAPPA